MKTSMEIIGYLIKKQEEAHQTILYLSDKVRALEKEEEKLEIALNTARHRSFEIMINYQNILFGWNQEDYMTNLRDGWKEDVEKWMTEAKNHMNSIGKPFPDIEE